ncbi:hypothetical protein WKV44_08425 [Spirochaetia bacterium 38H-sp]|uniref:FlgN protein n=1 Tax=Rarispira pelagica TaxID=3141764 RepID=A0ABU9UDH4_9SPIR
MVDLMHILMRVMKDLIRQLKEAEEIQQDVREALVGKDWSRLEMGLSVLGKKAEVIGILEEERDKVYHDILKEEGLEHDCSFSDFIASIDGDTAREFSALFLELKTLTFKVQSYGKLIESYAQTASATLEACLRELFPQEMDGGYQKDGKRKKRANAIVVNRTM